MDKKRGKHQPKDITKEINKTENISENTAENVKLITEVVTPYNQNSLTSNSTNSTDIIEIKIISNELNNKNLNNKENIYKYEDPDLYSNNTTNNSNSDLELDININNNYLVVNKKDFNKNTSKRKHNCCNIKTLIYTCCVIILIISCFLYYSYVSILKKFDPNQPSNLKLLKVDTSDYWSEIDVLNQPNDITLTDIYESLEIKKKIEYFKKEGFNLKYLDRSTGLLINNLASNISSLYEEILDSYKPDRIKIIFNSYQENQNQTHKIRYINNYNRTDFTDEEFDTTSNRYIMSESIFGRMQYNFSQVHFFKLDYNGEVILLNQNKKSEKDTFKIFNKKSNINKLEESILKVDKIINVDHFNTKGHSQNSLLVLILVQMVQVVLVQLQAQLVLI